MELPELIDGLRRPEAYPHPVDDVQVEQTHISVVFLADDYAYKIKKPVDLGFLDFTTLARREHFCHEEVRLNQRGAPGVYLGVAPVILAGGGPRFGGHGEPVEYAVRMRRLPPDRTLAALLAAGQLDPSTIERLGVRVAAYHAAAESGPQLARWGSWSTVARNVRENFEQLEPFVGRSLSRRIYDGLVAYGERDLARFRALIDRRSADGMTCDTHGDLHLHHVYDFPDRDPPADLVMVDCIEFNERFRYADPVSDIAFLAMDLKLRQRPDLAARLSDAYFAASSDGEGSALLPFYVTYRAVVRGKVESFVLEQASADVARREAATARARAYFLLALGESAPASERPCLLLTAGLPGTGKSEVARQLADRAGFVRVATDVERKRLAGVPEAEVDRVRLEDAYYAPEWNERVYDACYRRADSLLAEGRRVVVDGTFREARRRARFVDLARRSCARALVVVCDAPSQVVRDRLATRAESERDASDATWRVYELLAPRWEPAGEDESSIARILDTARGPEQVGADLMAMLAEAGLA